jgi:Fanconi anemia group J protein
VGAAMLAVCKTVPGGVLMFVPSYALMDKLTRRWQVSASGSCGGKARGGAADGRFCVWQGHELQQVAGLAGGPAVQRSLIFARGRQATGLWKQLEGEKHVCSEPRGAGDAFDKVIAGYYKAIKQGKGGLFLAVCRGKVRA